CRMCPIRGPSAGTPELTGSVVRASSPARQGRSTLALSPRCDRSARNLPAPSESLAFFTRSHPRTSRISRLQWPVHLPAEVATMRTIPGPPSRSGLRRTRRSWLRIGGLALGGLALPDILRAQASSGARNPAKGVIMVLLPGGPTHLDTFDLKPAAPAEIRGEFRPIPTKVPGLDLCELMPRLARLADKLAGVRSLVGFRGGHNTH